MARAWADRTATLAPELAAEIGAAALAPTRDGAALSYRTFRCRLDRLVAEHVPAKEQRDFDLSRRDAYATLTPHGTGEYLISGAAERVTAAALRIDAIARAARRRVDGRTLGQLRSDVSLDLILYGDIPGLVTPVPAGNVFGHTEHTPPAPAAAAAAAPAATPTTGVGVDRSGSSACGSSATAAAANAAATDGPKRGATRAPGTTGTTGSDASDLTSRTAPSAYSGGAAGAATVSAATDATAVADTQSSGTNDATPASGAPDAAGAGDAGDAGAGPGAGGTGGRGDTSDTLQDLEEVTASWLAYLPGGATAGGAADRDLRGRVARSE
jgi:hypothetical protein